MEIVDLEQSGFRRLKLVDYSMPDGDCNRTGCTQYPLQKLFQQFIGLYSSNPQLAAFLDEVPSESEVRKLLSQPSIVSLIDKFIADKESVPSSKKSVAKSLEYRTRGNQDYGCSKMAQAAYYYTMAIVYAPDVPEKVDGNVDYNVVDNRKVPDALSLAYGNRSAVFFELGNYDASLVDIEHALATGYPRQKYPKLLLRKVECLISLKRFGEAKNVWKQLCNISGAEQKNDERTLKIRLQLLDIEDVPTVESSAAAEATTNQMLPIINYLSRSGRYQPASKLVPLSAKLEPRTTANGIHLVAKQDIKPGEIIVVESPFVSILRKKYEFHFCHHCCRRLEVKIGNSEELCIAGSLVPCTQCTRVLYCSTDCRTLSWKTYHQYECSILPVLYEMTNFGHLAQRILLVTGLDVASRVIYRNFGKEEQVRMPDFSDPTDIAANYEHIHRLVLPKSELPPIESVLFNLASAVMAQLMKKCAFVRTDEQAKLAGSIVQPLFCQMYAKSHKISSYISTHDSEQGEKAFSIGLGIYPYLASAWKHSCDPNSMHIYVNGTLLLYRATKCIPAGMDVTISFGTSFMTQDRNERQEALWKQYRFWCACTKCVIEGRDGLDGKYFPIGCKDCGSTLIHTSTTSTSFHCSSSICSTVMSLSIVKQLYARVESHLAIVNRFLAGNITHANQLVDFERHLVELSNMKGMRNYYKLAELYGNLSGLYFTLVQNHGKSQRYFECSLEIIELHCGITEAFCSMLIKMANLYGLEAYGSGKIYSKHFRESYLRVLKRAIEFVRLFSLADAQDESSAPELLVDESRSLWNAEQNLVKRLNDFQGKQ